MTYTEELIQRYHSGDESAKETLLVENAGLIWSVCKRFVGRGTELDDLYQLGCLGFLKAIDGFDIHFGTQFSTYAVPKISGEIRRFLRDDGAIKVSRGIKERALVIKNAQNKLTQDLGREPAITELAQFTGLTAEEIAVAECATAGVESIHQENGPDGFTLENVLSDTSSEDVMLEHLALKQAVMHLPRREQNVITLRYYHGLTQTQISRILGVSQVQVSRIEKKAIQLLRASMQ